MHIYAPWTDEQIIALNAWQNSIWVHPFTCINSHTEGRNLIATKDGWICPHCDYTQNWAHDFMMNPESLLVFEKVKDFLNKQDK